MADTPLAQLDPDAQQALAELGDSLAELEPDDRQAVAELAQARADGECSRRQLLKAAGAIGAGALVGGGSAAALTGSAAADASTSDSDPDVGTPSNRADVFAAGVDAKVIDTERVYSESIPTLVRIYLDGQGNAVAVARDSDSVVDQGADHQQVIQSAISYVENARTGSDKRAPVAGFVDGGMEVFDIDSTVTLSGKTGLRNMTLDAGGRNGFPILSVEGEPGTNESPVLQNVFGRNSGDSVGLLFDQAFYVRADNIGAINNGGDGIIIKGGSAFWLSNVVARNNGGRGLFGDQYDENGTTRLITALNVCGFDFSDNGNSGVLIDATLDQSKFHEDLNFYRGHFANPGAASYDFQMFRSVNGCDIVGCWFESDHGINTAAGTPRTKNVTIKRNRMGAGEINTNATQCTIQRNFSRFSWDLNVASGADGTLVEYNDLNGGTYSNSGANTTRNAW